jgi:hypothetical protein
LNLSLSLLMDEMGVVFVLTLEFLSRHCEAVGLMHILFLKCRDSWSNIFFFIDNAKDVPVSLVRMEVTPRGLVLVRFRDSVETVGISTQKPQDNKA